MKTDVLCVGELLIDFTPGSEPASYIRNAGGAPANVAVAVARSGRSAAFLGKVGDDDFGRFLVQALQAEKVEVVCKALEKTAITTMAFVSLTPNGERTFTFARKPGADMLLGIADVKQEDIDRATIIHAGSCSLSKAPASDATVQAMRMAQEANKLVSFDVNYRDVMWDGDREGAAAAVIKVLPCVDLLKISDEEISMFGTESDICRLMQVHDVALAVITYGSKGAKCLFDGQVVSISGKSVKAVDTTGAGDAFWGNFLASLLESGVSCTADLTCVVIEQALRNGNIAGAICVQSKGAIASLPTHEQMQAEMTMNREGREG